MPFRFAEIMTTMTNKYQQKQKVFLMFFVFVVLKSFFYFYKISKDQKIKGPLAILEKSNLEKGAGHKRDRLPNR